MKKKILITVLAIFLVIQFIRPERNTSSTVSANDITNVYDVPGDVRHILKIACNDCHSNNTEYPWYTNIQPVGWWMQDHVDVGKKQLNFSEFGTYPAEGQHHKMEEVIEQVKGDHMPLNSYLWMHGDAKLNAEQKNKVIEWAERLRQHIAQQHNVN